MNTKKEKAKGIKIKSQAAMEYLMTYGWAILIVTLSLAVLYSLGILNSKNFAPRASPGSCFVFRPNGPGTTDMISLQGTCGYLPRYVADFWNCSGCKSIGYVPIVATVGNLLPSTSSITITWWTWPNGCGMVNLHLKSSNANPGGNGIYCTTSSCQVPNVGVSPPSSVPDKTWSFMALVLYSNGTAILYRNAQPGPAATWGGSLTGITNFYIFGYEPSCADLFRGRISNVQLYSTALTPQEVQYLYQQGIGGAPIRIGSLVGWWPLNGDAKDYSGNNLHGTITGGLTFVQNYNPP
jgi:hypothetical protein